MTLLLAIALACSSSADVRCPMGWQPLFNGMDFCGTAEQACDFECDILRDYCVAGCVPGAPDCDPIQWERGAVHGVPLQTRGACEAEWSGCRARCLP